MSLIWCILFGVGALFLHHPDSSYGWSDYAHDIQPVCEAFAAKFADAAANYTKCFIVKSRPMTLCTECVEQYLVVNRAYDDLLHVVEQQPLNGKIYQRTCSDWILNADRVMAIQQTKQFFEKLWNSSNCPNCFSYADWRHQPMEYDVAEHVIEFQRLDNVTARCFANFTSGAVPFNSTADNQSKPCSVCNGSYDALNSYYQELDDRFGTKLCMDIVDTMNYTRITWGHEFNCTGNTRQDGITITITVLFLILPAVFYTATYIRYQKLENKIVKQNRMRLRKKSVRNPMDLTESLPRSEDEMLPVDMFGSSLTSDQHT